MKKLAYIVYASIISLSINHSQAQSIGITVMTDSVSLSTEKILKEVIERTDLVEPNCQKGKNTGCFQTSQAFTIEEEEEYFITVLSRLQHADITLSLDDQPFVNFNSQVKSYPLGKGIDLKGKNLNIYARISNVNKNSNYSDIEMVIHTSKRVPLKEYIYNYGVRMDSGKDINKLKLDFLML